MPKLAKPLTAIEVSRLKAPGLHFVGTVPGLALSVSDSGARSWVLRVSVGAKRRDIGLGGFPGVPLAEAHQNARRARESIRQGVDPVESKRAAQSAIRARQAAEKTFAQCAAALIDAKSAGWSNAKHAAQWRATLDAYAVPAIGKLLVRDVDTPQVLEVLRPIWGTKPETASRLRGRIEQVLDWAIVHKLRGGLNPARWRGHLDKLLPPPAKVRAVEHRVAVPVKEAAAFMRGLREREGMSARCLEFVILTATRSGEARAARWCDIDLVDKAWTIPAPMTKTKRAHRVPLSDAAVELLAALPRFEGEEQVFPGGRQGSTLSDMSLTAVMRRMVATGFDRSGERAQAVVHGFRSTFRDWAAEHTSHPRQVVERALNHTVESKVEAAYFRSDVFERRRVLMQDWAGFVGQPAIAAQVVEIRNKPARRA